MKNQLIADLHLHSKYSRAVSQKMDLPTIALWGKRKGIDLLVTGDFTHPLWLKEIELLLKEVKPGIYQLKNTSSPWFVIGGEISSIYSQGGKTRRIHHLVLTSHLSRARKINRALLRHGVNLSADGRPITNLSGGELVDLVLSQDPQAIIIPCHIWTPWYSLYGSNSGFDSLRECFGPKQKYIWAVETGLSSDPAMNWQITELEDRQIVSFSDAHSPVKLGREATVFRLKKNSSLSSFSFSELRATLQNHPSARWEIAFTIEFYPEEGKYHYSGHRKCGISYSPEETQKKGNLCPVCGKPLTLGVLYRVTQLKKQTIFPKKKEKNGVIFNLHPHNRRPPYVMLVPLIEIIAEAEKILPTNPKTERVYLSMIEKLGSEFKILLSTPKEKITTLFGSQIGEGIERVRKQQLIIQPGYDGVFGQIRIWPGKEKKKQKREKQLGLF